MATVLRGDDNFDTADNATQTELDNKVVGKVLQVVSTSKTDTWSGSAQGDTDITGMTVTITPSSTSSKILITVNLSCGANLGTYDMSVYLYRGTTKIAMGDAAGGRRQAMFEPVNRAYNQHESWTVSNQYLDSPSTTSAQTYKLVFNQNGTGQTLHVNRSGADEDSAGNSRTISTITAMEISG